MEKLTHGSLFSGIGGFDLAAEWIGWENKFHCEWDDFGKKILSYYWPNAKSYGDITKTDFRQWRGGIDVLTGGFPCQPFSTAGKRLGKDDNRYLWPEMLRAIREIQPTWVIGENVGGIISMVQPCDEVKVGCKTSLLEEDYFTKKEQEYVVETICSDLEREGYSVQPVLIPACSVGAPHRRDRVWFVAYSNSNDDRKQKGDNNPEWEFAGGRKTEIRTEFTRHGYNEAIAYANGNGRYQCDGYNEVDTSKGWKYAFNDFNKAIRHTNSTVEQGEYISKTENGEPNRPDCGNGINNFQNFPTQSPICGGDDGIPDKLDGITIPKWRINTVKAYGNAIVPQVAYEIFKVIDKI